MLSLVMCSGHWSNLVIGENVLIQVVSKFPLSFGAQREEAENEISLNENQPDINYLTCYFYKRRVYPNFIILWI